MSVNLFRFSSKIFDIFSILMNGDQFGRHGNQKIETFQNFFMF